MSPSQLPDTRAAGVRGLQTSQRGVRQGASKSLAIVRDRIGVSIALTSGASRLFVPRIGCAYGEDVQPRSEHLAKMLRALPTLILNP